MFKIIDTGTRFWLKVNVNFIPFVLELEPVPQHGIVPLPRLSLSKSLQKDVSRFNILGPMILSFNFNLEFSSA